MLIDVISVHGKYIGQIQLEAVPASGSYISMTPQHDEDYLKEDSGDVFYSVTTVAYFEQDQTDSEDSHIVVLVVDEVNTFTKSAMFALLSRALNIIDKAREY